MKSQLELWIENMNSYVTLTVREQKQAIAVIEKLKAALEAIEDAYPGQDSEDSEHFFASGKTVVLASDALSIDPEKL